jgi:hypothetical protein
MPCDIKQEFNSSIKFNEDHLRNKEVVEQLFYSTKTLTRNLDNDACFGVI